MDSVIELGRVGGTTAPQTEYVGAAAAGDAGLPDSREQCQTFLELKPTAVSSIMGLFPPEYVARLKDNGIAWFATATTLAEAQRARDAGADAIIAQGAEAGGHR